MLTAPTAKALLAYDSNIVPMILDCGSHFEIVISEKPIVPQREITPRQFKTLSAAYLYLRNFLDYRGQVLVTLNH